MLQCEVNKTMIDTDLGIGKVKPTHRDGFVLFKGFCNSN